MSNWTLGPWLFTALIVFVFIPSVYLMWEDTQGLQAYTLEYKRCSAEHALSDPDKPPKILHRICDARAYVAKEAYHNG